MANPLTQLSKHLWVSQSRFADVNSGIFYSGDRCCLVDPGILPAEIDALVDFVEAREAVPQALILTHSHWDHLFGPERFPGVKVIAQANYSNEVRGQAGRQILSQVDRLHAHFEIERRGPFAIPQPDETFEDAVSMSLGDLHLQLIHAPGHSPDQLVVYQPGEGVLWAGDMLSDAEIPYVNHSLRAYEASLARLAALEINALVPGHGAATLHKREIEDRFRFDREYLAELRESVAEAVARGLSVAETVAGCADFRHPQLDENRDAHKLNIESVYIELGGHADPAKVGWKQAFD